MPPGWRPLRTWPVIARPAPTASPATRGPRRLADTQARRRGLQELGRVAPEQAVAATPTYQNHPADFAGARSAQAAARTHPTVAVAPVSSWRARFPASSSASSSGWRDRLPGGGSQCSSAGPGPPYRADHRRRLLLSLADQAHAGDQDSAAVLASACYVAVVITLYNEDAGRSDVAWIRCAPTRLPTRSRVMTTTPEPACKAYALERGLIPGLRRRLRRDQVPQEPGQA